MALYRAKASCPGRYVFFQNSMRAEAQARRDLDLKLRHAFAAGELELYFQPQIRLADSVLVGAEILLRWRREDGSVIAPGAFIQVLTASPIAIEVGTWILRKACEMAATWRRNGRLPVRIAVNLFPSQFNNASLMSEVEKILADTKLPPSALELEITENIALTCNADTLALLHKLRELGVQLAFDDFGTGYASLSFLTQMPLTHIKIDQSFIRGLPEDAKAAAIVRSLIVMAHNIGLQVIAEGVETAAQAQFLLAEGCDEAQGFLFAKPLPASAFEALLRTATSDDELHRPSHSRIALKA
jgi:EAL domain-containing protein (putative c-di-GMP-specific phosphodiesterase class I)